MVASNDINESKVRHLRRCGLSLLEVILSLAILAVAVAILSQTMFLAAENGIRSKEMMAGQMIAEATMAEVLTGILPAQSTSWTAASSSSSFTSWSYMIETLPAEQADMIGVQVTVTNDPERTTTSPIDVRLVRWIIDPNLGLDSPQSQTDPTGTASGAAGGAVAGASGSSRGGL